MNTLRPIIPGFCVGVDEDLILRRKFASRELFEKCEWHRSSTKPREECAIAPSQKVTWIEQIQCVGASWTIGRTTSRTASPKLRQPVTFFYMLQK
ncbi:hypothetical protein X777_12318 [Ooceraea biroi]|uniref:Uncharacterized protein n=1 Tax=Ooceraea biroi TaxID=2015173 RepID=A0A026VZQ3_OOCBI|nr:hypothetical protein X777_12318 [Ooceraea biroi]